MAYTPKYEKTMPIPVEPAVLGPFYIPNTTNSADIAIDIPWDNCRLTHAVSYVLSAIDAGTDMTIKLELDAAGGTEMGTITVAASSTLGDKDEMTISSESACDNLGRNHTSRDVINIETSGDAAATGAVNLLLYFEYADNK